MMNGLSKRHSCGGVGYFSLCTLFINWCGILGLGLGSLAWGQDPAPVKAEGAVIYTDPSRPLPERVDDLIGRMSLEEKVAQLKNTAPAIPRLGVPQYDYWNEALHGVARAGVATVFPQAIALAATWDVPLLHLVGETISTEGRAKYNGRKDANVVPRFYGLSFWSPNVNIFRDPRWGRGQETYGEDPTLTGQLAVAFINGIQGNDPDHLKALACAKHFAVHSGPESLRHSFNVDPDERDLYETYLPQFEDAVRLGHVAQVMSAYNALYGIPAPASKFLLTDILREKWGFDGYVVSDCDAVHDMVSPHHYSKNLEEAAAAAVIAGTDLNCGSAYQALLKAVNEKLISEQQIDTALRRVFLQRFKLGMFDPSTPWDTIGRSDLDSSESSALALRAASESIVLLKNNGVLPLDPTKFKSIAVIGANGDNAEMLSGNYNGTPSHPVTILAGIRAAVDPSVRIDYDSGPPLAAPEPLAGALASGKYAQALAKAAADDIIIYVGGISPRLEGEEMRVKAAGFNDGDRTRIELPEVQEQFVQALEATGKPVIFVDCSGSAIALKWEADHLPAILQAWYPGENGGTAVANILFGKVNPSGRLPVTFYAATSDLPDFTDYHMTNRTYRYFTGMPLYAFGHGLSYTQFQYGAPGLTATRFNPTQSIHLSVPISNIGKMDGDEIVQVYVKHEASAVPQPLHSLVAFTRLSVTSGQTAQAVIDVPVQKLRYWDVNKKAYTVEPGNYQIEVGSASDDIRCKQEITITSQ